MWKRGETHCAARGGSAKLQSMFIIRVVFGLALDANLQPKHLMRVHCSSREAKTMIADEACTRKMQEKVPSFLLLLLLHIAEKIVDC